MQPNAAQAIARQRGNQLKTLTNRQAFPWGADFPAGVFARPQIGSLSSPSPSANLVGWPDVWSGLVEGIFANRGSATSITARSAIDSSLLLWRAILYSG
jgi:hypothetical protein